MVLNLSQIHLRQHPDSASKSSSLCPSQLSGELTKAAGEQRRFNVTIDTTSFRGPFSCRLSKATCCKPTAETEATSKGRGHGEQCLGPAYASQASALLCRALDHVWDVNTEVRAFSRRKPLGIFEATGKRLKEAD